MQPKSYTVRLSRMSGTALVLGICGASELTPSVALGLPMEDVVRGAASSPWVWGGVGFVAGAATMAAISHSVHKSKMRELEERLASLEEASVVIDKARSNEQQWDEDATHAMHMRPEVVETGQTGFDADFNKGQSVENMLTQRLNRKALDAELPVIERAQHNENRWGNTGSLDVSHTAEVMKRLDGATRARIIERRIPDLASIVGVAEEEAVQQDPEATVQLDPAALVDRIMREELERTGSFEARRARPRLTVIEGTAEPRRAVVQEEYGSLSKEA